MASLTEQSILQWARAHFERTGDWPTRRSGIIAEAPRFNWARVDWSLKAGQDGLPGGSSLVRLIAQAAAQDKPPLERHN